MFRRLYYLCCNNFCFSSVGGNPLSCNCSSRWLQRALNEASHLLGGADVTITCFDDVTGLPRDVNDTDFSNCRESRH